MHAEATAGGQGQGAGRTRRVADGHGPAIGTAVEGDADAGNGHVGGQQGGVDCAVVDRKPAHATRVDAAGDGDAGGIQQPQAGFAQGCARVDADALGVQALLAGGLDEAAVAALAAAAGADAAVGLGGGVGPDDDLAAVARVGGIGLEAGSRVERSGAGVGDVRVGAMDIAANQDGTAAALATDVDHGLVGNTYFLTQDVHFATLGARGRDLRLA